MPVRLRRRLGRRPHTGGCRRPGRRFAVRAGARQIDGTLVALGAGPGNSPTEVLAAAFDRLKITTGVDTQGLMAAAEDIVKPIITRMPVMDRASIMQGYAGVYSSFLIHAERAAERYGVPAWQILQEVGNAGYVGGQEDMIVDVALNLLSANAREHLPA